MSVITEILFDTWSEGEWFIGFIAWLFVGILVFVIAGLITFGIREWDWSKRPIEQAQGTLVSISYSASTSQTHVAPVITGKSVGGAVYTTGSLEKKITVWKVDGHGTVICEKGNVFQFAPEVGKTVTLNIKTMNDECRIVGIASQSAQSQGEKKP